MVFFLLPLAINAVHDFLNHEHGVCTSKIEQHIHQKDIDCTLHLIKQSSSFLTSNDYKILVNNFVSNNYSLQYNFLKNHQHLSFSLRGPPFYVLT